MTVGLPNSVPSSTEANAIADRMVLEMRRAWEAGDRPRTEDYLTAYPALADYPGAAAELIYEEISLSRSFGTTTGSSEILRRFPQWAAQLRVLLELRDALDIDVEPDFPEVGDRLGGFELVAELGRGRRGRVYLARQPALADRYVVVKLTPRVDAEHVTLARLQHTNIVPLYAASDDVARRLRILCMPYFGGVTLADVLGELSPIPPADRTAGAVRNSVRAGFRPHDLPAAETPGPRWAGLDYVQLVAQVGACLAEALQFAHDRHLIHMDVKPSNILITADGEPMLLDFHLARAPIPENSPAPAWLGGTPTYMPREQVAAVDAVRLGRTICESVDGRADVYSLGIVLYEALGGIVPEAGAIPPLSTRNRRVSRGLSDVVARCLAADPRNRYATAGDLANDLRRHLADLPLRGVRNRSPLERWRKWRCRRPHAPAVAGALGLVLVVAALALGYGEHRRGLARAALDEGNAELARGRVAEARGAFRRGLALTEFLPSQGKLLADLNQGLRAADQAALADSLHAVAEGMRALSVADRPPADDLDRVDRLGRQLWERRGELFALAKADLPAAISERARADMLDAVLIWSHVRTLTAPAGREPGERLAILEVLDEVERKLGPCAGLYLERAGHLRELGRPEDADADVRKAAAVPASSDWDHVMLGTFHLRRGEADQARREYAAAVARDPKSFWARLLLGKCELAAGRADEALISFAVCVGIDPANPVGHLHKALAHARLGQRGQALADVEQALALDPANNQARTLRDSIRRLP